MNKMKYLLPIRSILFLAIFLLGAQITSQSLEGISNWWSIVATIVNILTIIILVLLTKKAKSNYAELINYKKGKTTKKQIIIMTLIVLFVGTWGMYLAGLICYGKFPYSAPMMIAPIPAALAIINFVLLPTTVSFAEDGLYLGCGVNQIKNKYAAIFVPAFFFALQHCFIPALLDVKYIIYRFLSFLPLTVILCWYYRKHRNPVPIMIGHALIEVASVVMILMTSLSPEIYNTMLSL
ncbi:CPBP family intramembrane metalloprotease [Candidatus Saccharibacteria bacterium]|nr:CPBP family intramembrane metalloprotease [Candidatus Saccharibacteria bacterium]